MAEFRPVYADLTPYRQGVGYNPVNPLDALIQGAQQGLQLQQLPQQLQDQQLARQLNNLLTQQKIRDLQNPQAALARDIERQLTIKGALNPELGIVRAQPGMVGETIFSPGAITAQQQAALPSPELLAMRQTALDEGGIPLPDVVIPTAPAVGVPETPISAFGIQTGLNINPNIPEQAQEDKLNREIQLASSRTGRASLETPVGMSRDQKSLVMRNNQSGQLSLQPIPGAEDAPAGQPTILPLPSRTAPRVGAAKGLTPNAQNALLKRYGAVSDLVGDIGDPANIDFNQLAIDVGKAERSQDLADLKAKESALTTAQKKDNAGFIAAKKDLIGLKTKIQELQEDGREPGVWQNAFSAAAASPSSGFFTSLPRQFANYMLNEDTVQKEAMRAGLDSAVTKALSGLAVTSPEAIRLSPLVPQKDDTLKIILQKTAALEDFLNNRIEGNKEAAGMITPPPDTSTTVPVRTSTRTPVAGARVRQGNKEYIFDGKNYNEVK